MFGFFGVTDIEHVRAEGIAISPDHRRSAVESALEQMAGVAKAA